MQRAWEIVERLHEILGRKPQLQLYTMLAGNLKCIRTVRKRGRLKTVMSWEFWAQMLR